MSVELLSRIQFAMTISFHYVFPPLSIGLGMLMFFFELIYVRTNKVLYYNLARFWSKIFAVIFGMGVATGVVMEFQFGTNWATYSRYIGDVMGSVLAAEGLLAFMVEAGFLSIVLLGWNRVSKKFHLFSTFLVWLGSMFSALWIVIVNSWQQTPAGYHIVQRADGTFRAEVLDYVKMIFNPSSMDRFLHVILSSLLCGLFLVISIHAYYIFKKKFVKSSLLAIKVASISGLVLIILQVVSGHHSALIVAEHQPEKLASFEGHFDSNKPGNLYLLGWVNQDEKVTTGLYIPKFLSFMISADPNMKVKGLNDYPEEDLPPVNVVFQTYHTMVALGMAMLGVLGLLVFSFKRRWLLKNRWFQLVCCGSVLMPILAVQLGWFSAEIGRQPWIVYHLMRTKDGISTNLTTYDLWFSIIGFGVIYIFLTGLFVFTIRRQVMVGIKKYK
ncbi:cytochrome ubiquinol oxidase subunit I [Halosquirtibacter xylanolyticus]|uniref:cytochrome ubiquinol oxidase subunit I n=1 Tax=Halosquirtibacter xylanolyticus TaxID=3374599 RepID=UPI003747F742|nr:cytochrome ubiquinol oxidase subunit I [Prolixibacteraceae bacterium]